jgi:pimeloyl-ACP methyl ester carboxylesterase
MHVDGGGLPGDWWGGVAGAIYTRRVSSPQPFVVAIAQGDLDDLRDRLIRTRWPRRVPGDHGWQLGADPETMRRLVERWADGYDWRAREREINELPHFTVDIDGVAVHYLHYRGIGTPLVLTHGWPGSFLEMRLLAAKLADRGFEVVVPSLPGFGFSAQRPGQTDPWSTPQLWHTLMSDVLGHRRYGAHGGDLGAGITTRLAARHPEALIGIHLLAAGAPVLQDDAQLTAGEQAFLEDAARWEADRGAYEHQQRTRPVTLSYGLSDSPVGLLAWLVEKLREWSDSGGDLARRFEDDEILTWVSLYWLTNTIGPSFRPYSDDYARPPKPEPVIVPTALAVFPADLVQEPREWVERRYALQRYTSMPRGGHFAAFEEPELLADDIMAFFATIE